MKTEIEKNIVRGSLCECNECVIRDLMFSHVHNKGSEYVCKTKVERSFKKGEIIVRSGDEIKNMIYIKEGLVKIYKSHRKYNDQIISITRPFEFTYLLSIFSDTHYNLNISAIEDTTVCYISLNNIKKMISENGSFAMSMLQKLSTATDNVINNFTNINRKNLRGRVAYILLLFSEEIYKSRIFNLPLSRKEIAELIGMTTENVIRIMSEMRKEEIIRIHTKEIEIKDYQRLKLIMEQG